MSLSKKKKKSCITWEVPEKPNQKYEARCCSSAFFEIFKSVSLPFKVKFGK